MTSLCHGGLVFSGVTAFPLEAELRLLGHKFLAAQTIAPNQGKFGNAQRNGSLARIMAKLIPTRLREVLAYLKCASVPEG